MKACIVLLWLTAFFCLALSSPVPDHVVLPRATTTASAAVTITPGATGIPASQANPAGCTNIDLAGETRNDITSGLPCKNFTLIFARGTFENGNIGGLVGPPFVEALVSMLGSAQVAIQGVNNYPADVAGFLAGGSATGSADMAQVRPITSFSHLPSLPLKAKCCADVSCVTPAHHADPVSMSTHKALRFRL
jgi:hypothetical protein